MIRVRASAPSNIALVKYMGKSDASQNIPVNGSLSLTLNSLRTEVEAERDPGGANSVQIMNPDGKLSETELSRVSRHIERVRDSLPSILAPFELTADIRGSFFLQGKSNFPMASGIASSASSFAAFTLASTVVCVDDPDRFQNLWNHPDGKLRHALALLSQRGSGSSCRSMLGPWVVWDETEGVSKISSKLPDLSDLVIIVASESKKVSSSEAHARVKTASGWNMRPAAANARLQIMKAAVEAGDFETVSQQSWQEFLEMHQLFHTSAEPFTYWNDGTWKCLRWLFGNSHGAITTMDAGPNIHVLVPTSDAERWLIKLRTEFPEFSVMADKQGSGAALIEVSSTHD